MERLTIDEIIEHCNRKVERFESFSSRDMCENWSLDLQYAKEYWEHRQVANYLEELLQYRAIRTVEELKELKDEQQNKCKDCAGCTMWKCDCANERAYAIDEFAEKILEYCSMSEMNRKMIKQIAEQLKEGGK